VVNPKVHAYSYTGNLINTVHTVQCLNAIESYNNALLLIFHSCVLFPSQSPSIQPYVFNIPNLDLIWRKRLVA